MSRAQRPVLLFDADCGFCRLWVERWKAQVADRVEFESYQEAAGRFLQIPRERLAEAVHLIEGGRVSRGAEAVFRALALAPGGGWALLAYERLPGFASASEAIYSLVASHRLFFSSLTRLLWGRDLAPASVGTVRRVFQGALALAYLSAFASLWPQIDGLLGPRGVLPVRDLLPAARQAVGAAAAWRLPSVFWWLGGGTRALQGVCAAGVLLSAAVLLDVAPGPCLAALWALYLSIVNVGEDFLSFQWDLLLIEAGLLALFWAPWRPWRAKAPDPRASAAFLWLLRWLALRLMLESGLVKLASHDPTWRGLTALYYHYETQPLPTWLGWWAHQLPRAFQRLSARSVFAIELGLPFVALFGRRPRLVAAAGFLFFQALIALTGNYAFFNLLTAALALTLLDDRQLRLAVPSAWRRGRGTAGAPAGSWRPAVAAPLTAFIALASFQQLSRLLDGPRLPAPLARVLAAAEPWRPCTGYGLFAVMTTSRLEIAIEGSDDGALWKEYPFRWKPGPVDRRPLFIAPHQPRLDWQMWFAALSSYRDNPWFLNLLGRLLEGSPPVLALFAANPFPDHPPTYVRALAYDYRFTGLAERRRTGAWWRRELKGLYCPVARRR